MLHVLVAVESDTWAPEDIERVLGRPASRTRTLGLPHPPSTRPSKFNAWYLSVPVDYVYQGDGEHGVSSSIVALGDDFARRLATLPRPECTVTLSIRQVVIGENDTVSQGIHFRVDALRWLTAAAADIDLDQDFRDTPEESS